MKTNIYSYAPVNILPEAQANKGILKFENIDV
jgi:hypothetical protein